MCLVLIAEQKVITWLKIIIFFSRRHPVVFKYNIEIK